MSSLNAWTHVAAIFNGTHALTFLNGTQVDASGCTDTSVDLTTNAAKVTVGGFCSDGGSNQLSDIEVVALANLGHSCAPMSLESQKLGRFLVKYTPMNSGRHMSTVNVYGQDVLVDVLTVTPGASDAATTVVVDSTMAACATGDDTIAANSDMPVPVVQAAKFENYGGSSGRGMPVGGAASTVQTKDQSMAAWIKPTLGSRMGVYCKNAKSVGCVSIAADGELRYTYGKGSSQQTAILGKLRTGQWAHVALVCSLSGSAKSLTWFLNGEQVSTVAASIATAHSTTSHQLCLPW